MNKNVRELIKPPRLPNKNKIVTNPDIKKYQTQFTCLFMCLGQTAECQNLNLSVSFVYVLLFTHKHNNSLMVLRIKLQKSNSGKNITKVRGVQP